MLFVLLQRFKHLEGKIFIFFFFVKLVLRCGLNKKRDIFLSLLSMKDDKKKQSNNLKCANLLAAQTNKQDNNHCCAQKHSHFRLEYLIYYVCLCYLIHYTF